MLTWYEVDCIKSIVFLNLHVQEKWMQRSEQNEWSDASWEHICFYRKVELWTDEVLDPEFTHIILNRLIIFIVIIYSFDRSFPFYQESERPWNSSATEPTEGVSCQLTSS